MGTVKSAFTLTTSVQNARSRSKAPCQEGRQAKGQARSPTHRLNGHGCRQGLEGGQRLIFACHQEVHCWQLQGGHCQIESLLRKALKSLVEKKKLVQTKGTGASGRFKANKEEKPKKVAKPKAKKVTKKKAAKKPAGEKKAKTPKKKAAAKPKKAAAAKKPKTPKKAKTPKKPAAKK